MMLVLNLKMNLDKKSIIEYEENIKNKNVIVLPQYPYLAFFNSDIYSLGSQDVSEYEKGSYTGEVCAKSLSDLGCKYCLVCHSEREEKYGEDKYSSLNKINNLLKRDIVPIYCVNEFENDDIVDKLSIINKKINPIVIAYEATWLIGEKITKKDVDKISRSLHKIKVYMDNLNISYKLIYGGGVSVDTIDYIASLNIVDGYIVSSNVLEIESLNELYNKINN